jgi:hypothetical protein
LLNIIKEKSELKFVESEDIIGQLYVLEDDGTVRPHFNNKKNCIGLRIFDHLNYYKVFNFAKIFNENDDFFTKDMEGILDAVFGIGPSCRTI